MFFSIKEICDFYGDIAILLTCMDFNVSIVYFWVICNSVYSGIVVVYTDLIVIPFRETIVQMIDWISTFILIDWPTFTCLGTMPMIRERKTSFVSAINNWRREK